VSSLYRSAGSFRFAVGGICHLFRTQPNARVHLVLATSAVLLSLALGLSTTEVAVVVLAIGLVIAAEAMNTAVEAIVDLVQPERHPIAGRAKDLAAGAVLISSIASAAVGVLLFVPRLLP
jgi:diacylglycerol kinase (ATP)